MTQSEIDILLKAIEGVREDVHNLDLKFENFRTYADLTYIRKDNLEAQKETRESFWKRHDRILARVAVLLSAVAVLVTILINLPK
jgi:hypothetical protein